jgi:hypothetical protein
MTKPVIDNKGALIDFTCGDEKFRMVFPDTNEFVFHYAEVLLQFLKGNISGDSLMKMIAKMPDANMDGWAKIAEACSGQLL